MSGHVRVWLTEIFQKNKDFVNTVLSELLSSQYFLLLHQGVKDIGTHLSESWAEVIGLFNRVSFPKLIYSSLSSFVGNDFNRSTLSACCFGFTIGSGVGLALGIFLNAPSKPVYMMRAIAATNFTGPDGIAVLEDIPIPTIKYPDQILVEVRYATLCQTDLNISSGYARVIRSILDPPGEPPVVLGRSGSGIVVEVGRAVSGIEPGDKVIFWCPAWYKGCLSQYAAINSWQAALLPKGVSLEDGAWSAYPSVLAWKYLKDSRVNTRELHSLRVFVHCGSNWVGDALRRVLASYGCMIASTTSHSPVGSSQMFPLSTAPLLLNDPNHRQKYDIVFNTEGEGASEFAECLIADQGQVVRSYLPYLTSDSFGSFLAFTISLWVRVTHEKWEKEGIQEGVKLLRSLGRAPQPQPPYTLDPSIVGISSVGAILISMEESTRKKKIDTIR